VPESAIIVPAPEAEPLVGRLRERFDPSAKVGLAAHITVLHPFVPPDQISKAVIARVRNVAQKHSPFAYSLNSIDRFANTLYLRPHPAEPFIDLVKGLVQHFPAYLPYGGRFDSIAPHLTVAHGEGLPFEELEGELSGHTLFRAWITASCETLALIENSSGLWRVRERFALGASVE